MCGQMVSVLVHANAFHSGRESGFDAVLGIFHNDAILRLDAQLAGRDQKDFRIWLPPAHIFGRDDSLKELAGL